MSCAAVMSPLALPAQRPLFAMMKRVMDRYTGLRPRAVPSAPQALGPGWMHIVAQAEPGSPGIPDLWLCAVVRLRGSHCLRLVLRAPYALGRKMAQRALGSHQPGAAESCDAFLELANLLASHLISEHLLQQGADFGPFLPEAGDSLSWPSEACDAFCGVMVDGQPMELRLWQGAKAEVGDDASL